MNDDQAFDRAMRDWLGAGDDRTRPATIDAVLLAVWTTPQMRTFGWWRAGDRGSWPWRRAAAGLLLAIVAVAGWRLLPTSQPGGGVVGAPPTPPTSSPVLSPAPTPSNTPAPSPTPSAAPSPSEAMPTPFAVPVDKGRPAKIPSSLPPLAALPTDGLLAPGTYAYDNPYTGSDPTKNCDFGCSDYKRIILTIPAQGWAVRNGFLVKEYMPGDERFGRATGISLSFWTIDKVYDDPCHWRTSSMSALDLVGHVHTSDGLTVPNVGGLLHQYGRNATNPLMVTIGGQAAMRVQLSVPPDLPMNFCDDGQYRSWSVWEGGQDTDYAPGQVDTVWEVDVDRRSLVIDAAHPADADPADLAELQAIIDSLIIDR